VNNQKSRFHVIFDPLRSLFLSGLLMLLPITLTVIIFKFLIRITRGWLAPLCKFEPVCLKTIPGFELLLAILIVIVIGLISRLVIFKVLVRAGERLIGRIPFVRPVYHGIKQIVYALTHQDGKSFQQMVWVEFPRKNCYSVGFLTGQLAPDYAPDREQKYFNVFVPNVPNLTAGHYIVVTESDFRSANLTRQEAIAIIISGGIVQPNKSTEH
jgi:uncharacterized membrane protein